jgi:hypothetical protein
MVRVRFFPHAWISSFEFEFEFSSVFWLRFAVEGRSEGGLMLGVILWLWGFG